MNKLFTLLVFTLVLTFSIANIGISQNKAEEISSLLEMYNDYDQFNGSVLVAHNGELVHKGGNGYANMEWDIKNSSDTKHRLGSITKQFTAMLILQLVEDGKLDLDTPVTAYLPNYEGDNIEKVTLHHLLTHTSGLPNYTSFPGFFQNDSRDPYTPAEFTAYFSDSTLNFQPGEKFEYSNSGYFLLGYIVEEVTGNSYEEELHDRIFEPLGMKNTGFDHHSTILEKRATGYERRGMSYVNSAYLDMSIPYAAGSLYSTAEDLYLWDQALYKDELISPELKKKMFTEHVDAFGGSYGYGWSIAERNGALEIGHGGGINGFNTLISRYPENKDVVILLNNTGGASLGEITAGIMAILYDQPYDKPKKSVATALLERMVSKGVESGLAHFEEIKDDENYQVNEREINVIGYQLMNDDKIKEAIAVFKLNTELFPDSWNVYDSYGEALMNDGQNELAIKNYKKSVEMNPNNQGGIGFLKELGVDVKGLVKEVTVDDSILSTYVGTYELQPGFDIVITKDGGQLIAQATGQGAIEIYPKSDTEFYAKAIEAQVTFNTNSEGQVDSFTLKQGGQNMKAKRKDN